MSWLLWGKRVTSLTDTAAGTARRKAVADAGTADSGRERAMLMVQAHAADRAADYGPVDTKPSP